MTTKQLHPDWPAADLASSGWDLPSPVDDLVLALDFSGADFGTATGPSAKAERFQPSEIARVVRYRVSYHDSGRYYSDEDATPDAENVNVWRPDNPTSGSELDMCLVGELVDGRWFALVAGNDYTGWGCCGDSCDVRIGDSEAEVVEYGLDAASRKLLGYEEQR